MRRFFNQCAAKTSAAAGNPMTFGTAVAVIFNLLDRFQGGALAGVNWRLKRLLGLIDRPQQVFELRCIAGRPRAIEGRREKAKIALG